MSEKKNASAGTVRFVQLYHKVNELRATANEEALGPLAFAAKLHAHIRGEKHSERLAEAIKHLEGQPNDGLQS